MKVGLLRECYTAAAWLSSVRVVRRRLKCRNERNPWSMLNIHRRLPLIFQRRKEGMMSNQHGAYILGYTHGVMDYTTGCQGASRS